MIITNEAWRLLTEGLRRATDRYLADDAPVRTVELTEQEKSIVHTCNQPWIGVVVSENDAWAEKMEAHLLEGRR
jgi:hypothetical protein